MAQCCIKECEKPVLASGMCAMHYRRMKKYGDPTAVKIKQLHGASLTDRFLHYTTKSERGCWVWSGSLDRNGYGRLNIKNRPELAHRLSWVLHKGEISPSDHVLHTCDNPRCVRPDHLFLGDQAANNADMISKGRHSPGVSRGVDHGCARLSEDDIRAIRASTEAPQVLAAKFGLSRRHVRDIISRKVWRHLI